MILKCFYAKLVKENGDEHESDCLKTMLAPLDRHLKEHGASFSTRADQEFEESCKVLNGCAKEIREAKGRNQRRLKHSLKRKKSCCGRGKVLEMKIREC